MVEYRCEFCHKLLCKWEGTEFAIEIVCTRCSALHTFGMKKNVIERPNAEGQEPQIKGNPLSEVYLCQTFTDSPKTVSKP